MDSFESWRCSSTESSGRQILRFTSVVFRERPLRYQATRPAHLPINWARPKGSKPAIRNKPAIRKYLSLLMTGRKRPHSAQCRLRPDTRSEEHTSELQSRPHLVCRLLLEKKKNINTTNQPYNH